MNWNELRKTIWFIFKLIVWFHVIIILLSLGILAVGAILVQNGILK